MDVAGSEDVEETVEAARIQPVVPKAFALQLHTQPRVICYLYAQLYVIFLQQSPLPVVNYHSSYSPSPALIYCCTSFDVQILLITILSDVQSQPRLQEIIGLWVFPENSHFKRRIVDLSSNSVRSIDSESLLISNRAD